MFGPDVANKIRKFDLRTLQEKQGQVFQQGKKVNSVHKDEHRSQTMEEFKARIDSNLKNML